jgi:hypothetical protein
MKVDLIVVYVQRYRRGHELDFPRAKSKRRAVCTSASEMGELGGGAGGPWSASSREQRSRMVRCNLAAPPPLLNPSYRAVVVKSICDSF